MATIKISHPYTMPKAELVSKLDQLSAEMTSRYQLQCNWRSPECLVFQRSGANGEIVVGDNDLDLTIKLGLMLGAFKSSIEGDIRRFIEGNIT